MWWGDQDLVKLGIKEHKIKKKALGWAVPFTDMPNFLPLGILVCLCTCVPHLVHTAVYPEPLQSHDLPQCPARSPSKKGHGFLGFQTYLSLSNAVLFWKKKNMKARAFRKQLPSRKTALPHPNHTWGSHSTGPAHCVALPSHRSGMGTKGREKAETKETNIHRICLVSSKQGVNAGPSPHTGVMSQGQNWWLSRREHRKPLFRGGRWRGERIVFTLDEHRVLSTSTGISPQFLMSQSKARFFAHIFPWCRHSPESFSCSGFSLPACRVVIPPWPLDLLVRFSGERSVVFTPHDPDQVSAAMGGMLEAKRGCSKDTSYASVDGFVNLLLILLFVYHYFWGWDRKEQAVRWGW